MPGNHGEISLDEQNEVDNDNKKTRKKKKKSKDAKDYGIEDDFENKNRLEMPLISKTRKRLLSKIRKKPKSENRCSSPSCSVSRRGGCFCVMRPRRTEEDHSCSSTSYSPLSDPNDENFSDEMMRVLLENNDFSSNDCNPHR